MKLTAQELEAYAAKLTAQQRAAQVYTETALRQFHALNPGISLEDFRAFAMQLMMSVYQQYGDQAAYYACLQYDQTAKALGYNVEPAQIVNDIDEGALRSSVTYFTRNVTDENFDHFAQMMAQKAYDHVARASKLTTIGNAEREGDRKAGMRYARVPTGRETCGFCLMLASRGFAYKTRSSAGDHGFLYNSFHNNCDCRVVPGNADTEVEGYDPDALYERYLDARATIGAKPAGMDAKRYSNLIVNELNRRTAAWQWSGKAGEITREPGAKPWKKEVDTAEILASHGFDIRFIKENKETKVPDAYLNGSKWEFKVPEGASPKTVKNQFKKAVGKGTGCVVLSGVVNGADITFFESQVKELFAGDDYKEICEVLIVSKDGSIRRIKR